MEIAKSLIEEGRNIFISSFGGGGKTFFLKTNEYLSKNAQFCGTTGMSAVGLMNDENHPMTIHSFFSIGLAEGTKEDVYKSCIRKDLGKGKFVRKHKIIERILKCQILVIDEASMLSAELLDKIEFIARMIKANWHFRTYNNNNNKSVIAYQLETDSNPSDLYNSTKTPEDIHQTKLVRELNGIINGDSSNDSIYKIPSIQKPFGGIQLVFSADLLQLRPIKENWIFKAKCFESLNFEFVKFSIPFRHSDIDFYHLLSRVRDGTFTSSDIDILKSRMVSDSEISNFEINGVKPTILFCKRIDVEVYNEQELNKLTSPNIKFTAKDSNKKFSSYFDDAIPSDITLKIGAQVMLKINLNIDEGLINGSRGVITDIDLDGCTVQFLSHKTYIERGTYWKLKNHETGEYETRNQIPLILCYGLTVHKSQGLTIDHLICDLSESFTIGMVYVALSRCRRLSDLHLLSFDPNKIKVSKFAFDFLSEKSLL